MADSNPSATIETDAENSSFLPATPIDLLLGGDGDESAQLAARSGDRTSYESVARGAGSYDALR